MALSNNPVVLGAGGQGLPSITGDVDGPSSSTDKAIARFNGITGKLIQNSSVTLSDTDGTFTQTTTNGGITLTAASGGATLSVAGGSNANITLTPSGSGNVSIAAGSIVGTTAATFNLISASSQNLSLRSGSGSTTVDIFPGQTQNARFTQGGHLLLGGLTTDGGGNKVLQIPSTNVVNFGATANITLGASADTTAGDAVLTTSSTGRFVIAGTGILVKPGGTVPIVTTNTAITSGAGVGVGTLTNAPASTNPTCWIPINDNGTTRYIPAW